MRNKLFIVVLGVSLFAAPRGLKAQSPNGAKDEQAIRATATSYRDAFNQGDAKAVAALFTENGENIDQTGLQLLGREAIAEALKTFFSQHKGAKIEINIQSIDFPQANLAVEVGTTQTTAPGEPSPVGGRYTAIHVKLNGKWILQSVHEGPALPPSNYEHLKDLEWLIGNWIDEEVHPDKDSQEDSLVVHSSCLWSANRNFLVRRFTATVNNRVKTTGIQHIAWYAPTKTIRSWTFDSDGSITVGEWSKRGDQWVVKTSETMRTGEKAVGTELLTRDTANTHTWQISERSVDGKTHPNLVVKVRRHGQ